MADVAKLVQTLPANGEDAADHLPIVLYFDKEPLAVTVNGTAARVDGNRALWCFPYPRPQGDALFHIEWTNPDGSPNVGTDIWLRVVMVDIDPLSIVTGTVSDGDADADPDLLNRDGIRFDFNDPVIGSGARLVAEDGEDLGWEAVWEGPNRYISPWCEWEVTGKWKNLYYLDADCRGVDLRWDFL